MTTAEEFGLAPEEFDRICKEELGKERRPQDARRGEAETFGEFIEQSVQHCAEKYDDALKALADS